MTKQLTVINTVEVTGENELRTAVYHALNLGAGVAKQCDAIYTAYLQAVGADNFDPFVFADTVGKYGTEWWNSARFELIEEYRQTGELVRDRGQVADDDGEFELTVPSELGDKVKPIVWTDFPGFNAIQSSFTAFRQKTSRQTNGWSFTVDAVSPVELDSGNVPAHRVTEPVAAQPPKKESAKGKAKSKTSRSRNGSDGNKPDTAAAIIESVVADKALAAATLDAIAAAYPDLIAAAAKPGGSLDKAATKTAGRVSARSRRGKAA